MPTTAVPGRVTNYRYRAEELRTLADSMTTQGAKDSLLQTAQGYDRLAETLEAVQGWDEIPQHKLRPVRFSDSHH